MTNAKRLNWGRWTFATLAVVAGVCWYVRSEHGALPEYQTAEVTRGDLTHIVSAIGQLDPVTEVSVGSQISGLIKRLFINYNSLVKSNQVIAEIDPAVYQINVQKTKADLLGAEAGLALAKAQARRDEELFAGNLLAAETNDMAQAQMEQAAAQVKSDEALLTNAEVQLSYCTIRAPIQGVVISREVDVGQTVAARYNAPTIAIIAKDLTKMQIDALVSEADIGGITTNQEVDFTVDAYPYRVFHGRVGQIRDEAMTNQNIINYDCVIRVGNPDLKLLPGMTANVSIITARRPNAVRIPNAALRFRPPDATNEYFQYLTQDPPEEFGVRARTRTVYLWLPNAANPENPALKRLHITVGISDGIDTEVLSGLKAGDLVVTNTVLAADSRRRPANPFRHSHHF